MPKLEIRHEAIESDDGTPIRYFDSARREEDRQLPPIVLANGLGGPLSAWSHQIRHLKDRFRIISWDYRGLYGSAGRGGPPADLSIQAHVRDLRAVLRAAELSSASFVGWSMGVQVALELYEQHPELVRRLVLVNGTFGKPLHGVALPFAEYVLPQAVHHARRLHSVGGKILQRASKWPETGVWLKRLGVISKTLDDELFSEMVGDFGGLDLDVYFTMLGELGRHDAAHVLPTIRVPTLIIAGARDVFTPPDVAQKMAQRIPHGELLIVRGATHYAAAEYPELVNLRMDKFFREHPLTDAALDRPA